MDALAMIARVTSDARKASERVIRRASLALHPTSRPAVLSTPYMAGTALFHLVILRVKTAERTRESLRAGSNRLHSAYRCDRSPRIASSHRRRLSRLHVDVYPVSD